MDHQDESVRLLRLLPIVAASISVVSALLLASPVAMAKEGVTARLTAPLALLARPGDRITVDWTLQARDDQGYEHPFNAIGVFVRLLSPSGGAATIGFASATEHADGRYAAQVTVPTGGIGGVQIGLLGSSDIIFPLENDPFGAGSRPASPAGAGHQEASAGRSDPVWFAIAVAVSFAAAIGLIGAIRLRRRRASLR